MMSLAVILERISVFMATTDSAWLVTGIQKVFRQTFAIERFNRDIFRTLFTLCDIGLVDVAEDVAHLVVCLCVDLADECEGDDVQAVEVILGESKHIIFFRFLTVESPSICYVQAVFSSHTRNPVCTSASHPLEICLSVPVCCSCYTVHKSLNQR